MRSVVARHGPATPAVVRPCVVAARGGSPVHTVTDAEAPTQCHEEVPVLHERQVYCRLHERPRSRAAGLQDLVLFEGREAVKKPFPLVCLRRAGVCLLLFRVGGDQSVDPAGSVEGLPL